MIAELSFIQLGCDAIKIHPLLYLYPPIVTNVLFYYLLISLITDVTLFALSWDYIMQ